jgi:ribosomal protein L30/L7E
MKLLWLLILAPYKPASEINRSPKLDIQSDYPFITNETWKFQFPKPSGIKNTMEWLRLKRINGIFEVDVTSMSPKIRGYLTIINQALKLFNPSDERRFSITPFISVFIDEREVYPGFTQSEPGLHVDDYPGFVGKDGKIYNGHLTANSLDNSCLIVPARVKGDGIEDWVKAKELLRDDLVYMAGNQFYFIGPNTPHEAVPVREKVVLRQTMSIILGIYLIREAADLYSEISRYAE